MHILVTQAWPFLSSICWMHKQFSAQPFQHRCTSRTAIHEALLPPQNKAVNELAPAKQRSASIIALSSLSPSPARGRAGLVSTACWRQLNPSASDWWPPILHGLAAHVSGSGSPGRADTLAVRLAAPSVCGVPAAGSCQAPPCSWGLLHLARSSGHNTVIFFCIFPIDCRCYLSF